MNRLERAVSLYTALLWVVAVLISCAVFGGLSGTETSAYHARMAELFREQGYAGYDPLSYGGREFTYYPLGYIIAGLVLRVVPPWVFYTLLPALSFGIYILLLYHIHRRFADEQASMSMVLLTLSIAYGSFGRFFIHQLAYLPAMASVLLYMRRMPLASGALAGVAGLIHLESLLFVGAFLGALSLRDRSALLPVALGAVVAAPYYLHLLASSGWYLPLLDPRYRELLTAYWGDINPDVQNLLTLRYFLFLGVAGALGMLRRAELPGMVLIGALLAISGTRFISPLGVVLFSVPAAVLFSGTPQRRALLLGAAVYSLVYLSYAVSGPLQAQTDPALLDTLEWIRDNTPEDTTVVAPMKLGHQIAYYAQRKNFADGLMEFADLRKAELSMQAFRGNTSALQEILSTAPEPKVFLVRKGTPAYRYLSTKLEVMYEHGSYAVLG